MVKIHIIMIIYVYRQRLQLLTGNLILSGMRKRNSASTFNINVIYKFYDLKS